MYFKAVTLSIKRIRLVISRADSLCSRLRPPFISVFCVLLSEGQSTKKKGDFFAATKKTKTAAIPHRTAAADFLRQTRRMPRTCRTRQKKYRLSSSPDLRILNTSKVFSGFPNDRLSPFAGISALTVAVPSVNFTRFSILPRHLYAHRQALKLLFHSAY